MPPVIDDNRLAALRSALSAEAFRRATSAFVDMLDARVEAIAQSGVANGRREAEREAHALKGVCTNFGAARLGEIAARIERTLAETDEPVPAETIADLREAGRQTSEALSRALAET